MARYRYIAVPASGGAREEITIEADNVQEAAGKLRGRGMLPLTFLGEEDAASGRKLFKAHADGYDIAKLNHSAKIHNADLVGKEFNYRQIVRYKEIGEVHRALKILKKVDDLRLNRHIERRYGLVTDNELRLYRERSGNTDPLSLSA